MNRNETIRKIEETFCNQFCDVCTACPLNKYRIFVGHRNFAICYFGNYPQISKNEQVESFLRIARVHWNKRWETTPEMRQILRLKARVV